jgi:hypothetical protein
MKPVAVGEALDRGDAPVPGIERQRHATASGLTIEPDRAGRTRTTIAADFGAGQAELVAQDIDQRGGRFRLHQNPSSVYHEIDRDRTRTKHCVVLHGTINGCLVDRSV